MSGSIHRSSCYFTVTACVRLSRFVITPIAQLHVRETSSSRVRVSQLLDTLGRECYEQWLAMWKRGTPIIIIISYCWLKGNGNLPLREPYCLCSIIISCYKETSLPQREHFVFHLLVQIIFVQFDYPQFNCCQKLVVSFCLKMAQAYTGNRQIIHVQLELNSMELFIQNRFARTKFCFMWMWSFLLNGHYLLKLLLKRWAFPGCAKKNISCRTTLSDVASPLVYCIYCKNKYEPSRRNLSWWITIASHWHILKCNCLLKIGLQIQCIRYRSFVIYICYIQFWLNPDARSWSVVYLQDEFPRLNQIYDSVQSQKIIL